MVRRIQGWDPVLIVSQIITLQALHYLLLALLTPPIVTLLTDGNALTYAGGAYVESYVLDWREMASRTTARELPRKPPAKHAQVRRDAEMDEPIRIISFRSIEEPAPLSMKPADRSSAQGVGNLRRDVQDIERTHYAVKDDKDDAYEVWDYGVSRKRGWVLAWTWIFACLLDVIPLYYLIRKPTHILDFSLTLLSNHIVLTTYHTGKFPTSLFFWLVMGIGSALTITCAEQLCVRREMNEGLGAQPFGSSGDGNRSEAEAYELDDR